MKRKQYETIIEAPRERVWEVLWNEKSYIEWTSAFAEGSKVESNWEEGGKILFLNAENEGMIARIQEKKKPEKMAFTHLGMVDKNGKEDFESPLVKAWSGAEEIYILEENGEKTRLRVTMDMDEGHEEFFDNAWPKAFEKLKDLAASQKQESNMITVSTVVNAPVEKVWKYWTEPQHITQWNFASPDWHSPSAENDLREQGRFSYRMEAKDGSHGFDFEGTYHKVEPQKQISYLMDDDRKAEVHFREEGNSTVVEETFEIESSHSAEMQKEGWQAILDNFKAHVEKN